MAVLNQEILNQLGLEPNVQSTEKAIEQLDNSLSKTLQSDFTKKLIEADVVCDNAVRFISTYAESYMYAHAKDEQEAGELLHKVIKRHIPRISELGYVNEMAKIKALHTELQEEKYISAAQLIKMEPAIEHLIKSRDTFEALYLQKNIAEKGKTELMSTREASDNVITELQSLIQKLNAHLLLNPSDALNEMASSCNSVLEAVSQASK